METRDSCEGSYSGKDRGGDGGVIRLLFRNYKQGGSGAEYVCCEKENPSNREFYNQQNYQIILRHPTVMHNFWTPGD